MAHLASHLRAQDARMHVGLAPCWHCRRYGGLSDSAYYTRCTAPLHSVTQANPWHGCSCFEREPGADDEPGPPTGFRGRTPGGPDWRDVVVTKPAGLSLYAPGPHPLLASAG
jgi:hypothetical protein